MAENGEIESRVRKVVKSRFLAFVLMALLLAVPCSHAWAGDLRCGGRLISVGATKYEVLARCGEPDYRESRFEKRIKRDLFRDLFPPEDIDRYKYREPLLVEEIVVIEVWTYNLGPTKFIRYLYFENERLVEITTGDYGF